ncbi:hypothetical protein GGX14DRAFT_403355 [Mycena pura]|uniref:Uncharacterized protein n=1 Tax=Mycena pura TaxID=153505 RepID=A0AAD6UW20_9AGAR|nr:hypothetical protein GGX14DRAFT_403355 [Mycena pura]
MWTIAAAPVPARGADVAHAHCTRGIICRTADSVLLSESASLAATLSSWTPAVRGRRNYALGAIQSAGGTAVGKLNQSPNRVRRHSHAELSTYLPNAQRRLDSVIGNHHRNGFRSAFGKWSGVAALLHAFNSDSDSATVAAASAPNGGVRRRASHDPRLYSSHQAECAQGSPFLDILKINRSTCSWGSSTTSPSAPATASRATSGYVPTSDSIVPELDYQLQFPVAISPKAQLISSKTGSIMDPSAPSAQIGLVRSLPPAGRRTWYT